MYVCVCICMCMCVHEVRIHFCKTSHWSVCSICTHTCAYECTCSVALDTHTTHTHTTHTHTTHTHPLTHICVHTCPHTHMCVHIRLHTHISIPTCVYTHVHVHTHVHRLQTHDDNAGARIFGIRERAGASYADQSSLQVRRSPQKRSRTHIQIHDGLSHTHLHIHDTLWV